MNYEQAVGRTKRYKEGDLRVWHIPQVPGRPFIVHVKSAEEGLFIMNMLADYDKFQYEENVKPDYSNANGLDVFEDGEWVTWYDENGYDIDEFILFDGNLMMAEWLELGDEE